MIVIETTRRPAAAETQTVVVETTRLAEGIAFPAFATETALVAVAETTRRTIIIETTRRPAAAETRTSPISAIVTATRAFGTIPVSILVEPRTLCALFRSHDMTVARIAFIRRETIVLTEEALASLTAFGTLTAFTTFLKRTGATPLLVVEIQILTERSFLLVPATLFLLRFAVLGKVVPARTVRLGVPRRGIRVGLGGSGNRFRLLCRRSLRIEIGIRLRHIHRHVATLCFLRFRSRNVGNILDGSRFRVWRCHRHLIHRHRIGWRHETNIFFLVHTLIIRLQHFLYLRSFPEICLFRSPLAGTLFLAAAATIRTVLRLFPRRFRRIGTLSCRNLRLLGVIRLIIVDLNLFLDHTLNTPEESALLRTDERDCHP